jgi:hypothetical protein
MDFSALCRRRPPCGKVIAFAIFETGEKEEEEEAGGAAKQRKASCAL